MPGFYLLTSFNYFIVVPASGELPSIYFEDLKLKHQPVTSWVKFTSNTFYKKTQRIQSLIELSKVKIFPWDFLKVAALKPRKIRERWEAATRRIL